jgi:hypothetical protein
VSRSSDGQWWLNLFARLAGWVRNGRDERHARRRRTQYGRRGWLVSWHLDPDGGWRARLSGPRAVRTIERSAPTRVAAIDRAGRAMLRLLAFRAAHRASRQGTGLLADPSRTGSE